MATARMLRSSRPIHHVHPPGSGSSSVSSIKCIDKTSGFGGQNKLVSSGDDDKKKPKVEVKASVAITTSLVTAEPTVDRGSLDLASLLAVVGNALVKVLRPSVEQKQWKVRVQMLIEKAIIDCRFFTLFAVGGSLLSSVLCFVEGCFLIAESYFHYFTSLSHSLDQGHIMQLLVEAIDMFLVGTAMFIFGVGLYTIFVGSKSSKENGALSPPESNLFGLFYLKTLPTWVQVESVSQAKSRIGQAVMMILQVGLLEKFKNIPLVTSADLACFAGAVLVSSASIFIFSKLYVGGITGDGR